jgi:Concanavalin A-like lectin/glucanases superfamily
MKTLSIIATCSLLLIQSLQNLHADAPTNGLIAYYPFDGNGNDASGNGRNLTINGCGFTNGIRGQALNFTNGRGVAKYATNPELRTNNFSFSLWFNPTTLSRGYPEWMYLVGGIEPSSWLRLGVNAPSSTIYNNHKELDFGYGGGATAGWFLSSTSTNSNSMTANVWNHIVATAQGTNEVAIYVNGRLLNKYTNNPPITIDQNSFHFGDDNNQYPVLGQMDQIRLYNRALTSDEVLALYNLDHIKYVTLVLKSSSDLTSWQPAITNRIETYNPTEFYQTDITVSDTPPPQ